MAKVVQTQDRNQPVQSALRTATRETRRLRQHSMGTTTNAFFPRAWWEGGQGKNRFNHFDKNNSEPKIGAKTSKRKTETNTSTPMLRNSNSIYPKLRRAGQGWNTNCNAGNPTFADRNLIEHAHESAGCFETNPQAISKPAPKLSQARWRDMRSNWILV